MRSLRRDLFERRLWPLAVALVAVIAAVPFLLHGQTAGAPVAPPPALSGAGAPGVAGARQDTVETRRPTAPTSHTRDPFQPTDTPSALHLTRTSPRTTTTASTAPTPHPAPVVHTSPATTRATPPSPTPTSSAPSTPVLSSPPVVPKPTATGRVEPRRHHAATRRSWDIYSVDLRIGAWGRLASRRDPARLTPLPSERAPQVMYLGVTDHGRRAVFALGAGVEVRADGKRRSLAPACSPSRVDCALVVVSAGGRVRLRYVSATGAQRTLILVVSRITTRLTRSTAAARAARDHISAVGLCELKLGDPIGFFDPAAESVKLPSTASCRRDRRAVPFPGSLGAGSSVRG